MDASKLLLYPEGSSPPEAPRGAEAVPIILQGSPNQWFYVSELVEALKVRGWLPDSDNPANAVRTALERVMSTPSSDVFKTRRNNKVLYSYRPDDAPYEEEPF